jgi:polysaccharide export outer membrane protein
LAQVPQAVSSPVLAEGYVLGPGDIIEVSVAGDGQVASRVQIQSDGMIQLALIGAVQASGRTVVELRDRIANALKSGGYFTNPAVNITVVNFASRYVVVLGDVNQPGTVPMDRAYHVSDILARVGGVKSGGAKVLKLRRATGEELILDVNLIATGGQNEDPLVQPGDKLFVPSAQTFYISGQVNRPGTYPLDEKLTLRKALAVAGGVTQLGSAKKAKVIRNGKELKNFDLDAPLELGDVVEVGERFF